MHRAGTSAFTGAIAKLGVPAGSADALKPGSASNELGFWEVGALNRFNEELLAALGGGWASPPVLADGWHEEAGLEPHRRRAADLFAQVHTTRQWVWKDPRNSLVLSFWLSVLQVAPVLVICYRSPLEVQASLARRDGFSKPFALSLWERYTRAALGAGAGRPALVFDYARLLADPLGSCARLRAFLVANGVECPGSEDQAAAFVRAELHHARAPEGDRNAQLSEPQRRLLALLAELEGDHDRLVIGQLPAETPDTEVLLGIRRGADVKLHQAKVQIEEQAQRDVALREKLATSRARNEKLETKLAHEREKLQRERRKQRGEEP